MQNGMEIDVPYAHLIVMDRQMRVEFAGHALELATRSGEHPSRSPIQIDYDAGKVGGRRLQDITQSPARPTNDECRFRKVRRRHGQLDGLHHGKITRDIQLFTKTNRNIASGALGGVKMRQAFPGLSQLNQ
jgi:hypothetical protein